MVRQAHHPDPELVEGERTEVGVTGIYPCDLSRRSLEGEDGSDPGYYKRRRFLPQRTQSFAKLNQKMGENRPKNAIKANLPQGTQRSHSRAASSLDQARDPEQMQVRRRAG